MKAPAKSGTLLMLVDTLKACPAQDHGLSTKLLLETWNGLKRIDLEHGDAITPAIMAGLVLFDEDQFAPLLNEAERAQILALAKLALERYQQKTNPPNKLGKTIAASLKELA